jgi:hypothetical protein
MSRLWSLYLVLAVGLATLTPPSTTVAVETVQRTVHGTVVAANIDDVPQTIVIKVILPNRDDLIVGARVPTGTRITRGSRPARLADIKAGESADLTYLKTSDGLIARSIHLGRTKERP